MSAVWYNCSMNEDTHITITVPDTVHMSTVVGISDSILHIIQESFSSRITVRGNLITVSGDSLEVQCISTLLSDLIKAALKGDPLSAADVTRSIELVRCGEFAPSCLRSDILLTHKGRVIRPKTAGQKYYVDAIRKNVITFGIGPAGTGKTYLAMAMAIAALKRHEVRRIILTRPVVEAGESLGFLPGSLTEKVDPYIRPLYDALFEMTEVAHAQELIDTGVIEIAPLAFMRGRTLNDSFVILDEAQNTTPDQMKMFLTRLGFNSKMVITGDVTQLDLPRGKSGLKEVRHIVQGIEDIEFCDLTSKDVVRHSLVARIVAAYDAASHS